MPTFQIDFLGNALASFIPHCWYVLSTYVDAGIQRVKIAIKYAPDANTCHVLSVLFWVLTLKHPCFYQDKCELSKKCIFASYLLSTHYSFGFVFSKSDFKCSHSLHSFKSFTKTFLEYTASLNVQQSSRRTCYLLKVDSFMKWPQSWTDTAGDLMKWEFTPPHFATGSLYTMLSIFLINAQDCSANHSLACLPE